MERINVTIRKDQKAWLEAHPSISVSGLLQEALDQRMQEIEGFLTLEQFELEKEGLHKKVLSVLKENPDKALSIKSIARKMGLPQSMYSEMKVRFAVSNLALLGKVDSVIKGNEEYIKFKSKKGGDK